MSNAREFWTDRINKAFLNRSDAELERFADEFTEQTGNAFVLEVFNDGSTHATSRASIVDTGWKAVSDTLKSHAVESLSEEG